jgi:hypothetical protein
VQNICDVCTTFQSHCNFIGREEKGKAVNSSARRPRKEPRRPSQPGAVASRERQRAVSLREESRPADEGVWRRGHVGLEVVGAVNLAGAGGGEDGRIRLVVEGG